MLKYAAYSPDATRLLREKTGSVNVECYVYIDPEEELRSFILIKYPDKIAHLTFGEIEADLNSFPSMIEGVYQAIYG